MLYIIIAILTVILLLRAYIDWRIFRRQVGVAALISILENGTVTAYDITKTLRTFSSNGASLLAVIEVLEELVAEGVLVTHQEGSMTYYGATEVRRSM